jgi:hypothetical protein
MTGRWELVLSPDCFSGMKDLVEEYRREAAQLRQLALDSSDAWSRDLLERVAQVCDNQAERARTTPHTRVSLLQPAA